MIQAVISDVHSEVAAFYITKVFLTKGAQEALIFFSLSHIM